METGRFGASVLATFVNRVAREGSVYLAGSSQVRVGARDCCTALHRTALHCVPLHEKTIQQGRQRQRIHLRGKGEPHRDGSILAHCMEYGQDRHRL